MAVCGPTLSTAPVYYHESLDILYYRGCCAGLNRPIHYDLGPDSRILLMICIVCMLFCDAKSPSTDHLVVMKCVILPLVSRHPIPGHNGWGYGYYLLFNYMLLGCFNISVELLSICAQSHYSLFTNNNNYQQLAVLLHIVRRCNRNVP